MRWISKASILAPSSRYLPYLICWSIGILTAPVRSLLLNKKTADTAITTSTPRNSIQSQLPIVDPLADTGTLPISEPEILIYGKIKAMKAMMAAPPAITYPRFCSCLILSIKVIESLTFPTATKSCQRQFS